MERLVVDQASCLLLLLLLLLLLFLLLCVLWQCLLWSTYQLHAHRAKWGTLRQNFSSSLQ